MNSNTAARVRIIVLALFLLIVPGFFIWRLYVLQIRQHAYYLEKARQIYTSKVVTTGKRGEIFDVNGSLLVGNVPCCRLTADPSRLKNDHQRLRAAALLQVFLGGERQHYYEMLNPTRVRRQPDGSETVVKRQYVKIESHLSLETAEKLRAAAKKNKLNLFFFEDDYMRSYPKGRLLANLLGFNNIVEEEEVPQIGLEKNFKNVMAPGQGSSVYEKNRRGIPLPDGVLSYQAAHDGKNLYLTIAEPIQTILEAELDAAFEKWHPDYIYAAIADPKTGRILAMAQRPTFDPNDRKSFTDAGSTTKIAQDAFEPGSIMKPFMVGKALDWGIITPETQIDCNNGIWFYLGKAMSDSHKYAILSAAGVIQKSSNIGTAKIGLMMGERRVRQTLETFKFGTRTGLPLPGETQGSIPTPNGWKRDKLLITRVPIGYAVQVSPLQIIRAYCALANHGWMPQLQLIDHLEDPATGEITRPAVEPPVQTFERPEAHAQLVEMMLLVTRPGGTAVNAAIPGYEVAGKTGTARKFVPGVGYAKGQYFSSFVGFVPARDPALVMHVTVDNPKGRYYAATVAAPIFKSTASQVLKYLDVKPDPALLAEAEKEKKK